MFNDVRKGMGLKEERTFKNHIQLDSISEVRESFVNGQLFDLGESEIIFSTISNHNFLKLGHKLNPLDILFKKIDKKD